MCAAEFKVQKLKSEGTKIETDLYQSSRLWIDPTITVYTTVGAYEPYSDSVFRIVPYIQITNDNNKQEIVVDPFKYKVNKKNTKPVFGNWCYQLTLVEYFGRQKKHMALEPEFGKVLTAEEYRNHPYIILLNEIKNAVNNERLEDGSRINPDWFGYVGKTSLKSKILPTPTRCLLMRVLIYKYGNKTYFNKQNGVTLSLPAGWPTHPEQNYCILGLHGSALESFLATIDERLPNQIEIMDEDDLTLLDKVFKYPDITHPEKGYFVYFYREDTDPRTIVKNVVENKTQEDDFLSITNKISKNNNNQVQRYACFLSKYFPLYDNTEPSSEKLANLAKATLSSKSLISLYESQKEWKDILKFYSLEEQIEIINSSFPPELLSYAYRHHPHYLTSTTISLSKQTSYFLPESSQTQKTTSNIEISDDDFSNSVKEEKESELSTAESDINDIIESAKHKTENPFLTEIIKLAKQQASKEEKNLDELI